MGFVAAAFPELEGKNFDFLLMFSLKNSSSLEDPNRHGFHPCISQWMKSMKLTFWWYFSCCIHMSWMFFLFSQIFFSGLFVVIFHDFSTHVMDVLYFPSRCFHGETRPWEGEHWPGSWGGGGDHRLPLRPDQRRCGECARDLGAAGGS